VSFRIQATVSTPDKDISQIIANFGYDEIWLSASDSGAVPRNRGVTDMDIQQLFIVLAVTCAFALPCSVPALTQTTDAGKALVANEALQQAIHDYILAHPEVLIQSLRIAKEREENRVAEQKKALVASLKNDLVDDPNAPVRGNPSGDVTLIEFFDYRCPYCRQVEPFLQALIKNDHGLRLVVKELPILGPASVYAARVALAAYKQGKYEQFHDAVMSKRSNFDEATLLKLAEEAGVTLDRLKMDMNSPDVDAEIKRTTEIAKALRLSGTPAFIVGNEFIPGATDLETLRALVDEVRHGTN
jgi:protein-disulfide isomerase